jgi:hypothetical protein
MPVPWLQIVQLMPSIVEVSRELLKRTRGTPPAAGLPAKVADTSMGALEARIARLEENERRQAELVSNMAQQLDQLTTAITALHRQWRVLMGALAGTAVLSVVALVFAIAR